MKRTLHIVKTDSSTCCAYAAGMYGMYVLGKPGAPVTCCLPRQFRVTRARDGGTVPRGDSEWRPRGTWERRAEFNLRAAGNGGDPG